MCVYFFITNNSFSLKTGLNLKMIIVLVKKMVD